MSVSNLTLFQSIFQLMYTYEHTFRLRIPAAEGEEWYCFASEEHTAAVQVPFQLGLSPS